MMLEADVMLSANLVFYTSLSFPSPHDLQPQQPNSVVSGWLFGQKHELALGMGHEMTKSYGTIVQLLI